MKVGIRAKLTGDRLGRSERIGPPHALLIGTPESQFGKDLSGSKDSSWG